MPCEGQRLQLFPPTRLLQPPPKHNNENVAYVTFKCKTPTCVYSTKRLITSAPLAHLYSHGFRCAQDKGKAVEHLSDKPAWEGMGKLEGREVLQQYTLWCACNGCPFGLTEDDKLPRLLNEVAHRHRPSAIAISVAVNDLSDFCVAEVRSLLDRTYGTIYLAPNGIEVLGVLAFFKTKAGSTELVEHVVPLDFIVLVNPHSTSPKWCMSSAISMGFSISEYGLGKDKWVPCWAHILNLMVTTIFAYFDSTTESRFADPRPESEGEDPSVEDQHQSLNTGVVWFSDNDTAKDTPSQKKRKSTERPGGQTKPAEPEGKDRDSEKIQTNPKYNIKKENHLNRGDFRLLSNLLKVLEPFEDLTVTFSTPGGGQIKGVLPMIDLLVRHLKGFLDDPNSVPTLHILGLEKLFNYYGKTGDCPYYTAAILLHPAGGTRYLKFQNWPQVWIDDTIEATQAMYNTRHWDKACAARTKAQDHRASSSVSSVCFQLVTLALDIFGCP
ncbi:hypothetical protein JCM21900_001750, partial [Sporobolomyces salmonicolor]